MAPTPILIDNRFLLKIGIISMLVITFVFGGGFFMGYQQAATVFQADNKTQPLPASLDESHVLKKDTLKSAIEPKVSLTKETGEKKGVDKAKAKITTKTATQTATASVVKVATQENTDSKKKVAKRIEKNSHRVTKEKAPLTDIPVNNTADTRQLNKIKYSIQVGVYVDLINAKNMMKMLQAQQYDAYVADFINKNNETRYNVRVGYFMSKKSAVTVLNQFKENQKSDGYLVNFSAINMVDFTDDSAVEKTLDAPLANDNANDATKGGIKDEMKKEPSPIVVPMGAVQEKVSQTSSRRFK